ncbi:uncharacterized protein LOC103310204 [Acyrthosiphon pisum]|uniref:MYND-type domain-containing protein n=1 Tax=Acyrthosiphon pisum TaxID=7029 RepID=A0A8R2NVJ4_ACYPI|nr:uncharacterized protein LOC103310204 [Acyrthosiphon pisum]XP_029348660.1 uncharacterized protein LOC103310204 [Acyrthosiphon pisum]|eukprot:XP_008185883.1 PREDICTED: uncharacterized protein LOC103310204 [Acyrthosiphon pisum]
MDNTYKKIYSEEISSTSTEEEPMVIDREEPTTSSNSSSKEFKSKIWVKDLREMMDADIYKNWICQGENCNIAITTICNKCKMVRYCSDDCQQRDWFKKHAFDCDELQNQIQAPP